MIQRATSARVARSQDLAQLTADLGDWTVGTGPLFRRLARALAGAVDRGTLAPGARLPSERALAAATWSSRGTAVAAYDLLVGDGVIERRRGSGTFVAESDHGEDPGLPANREGSALLARLAGSGQEPGPGIARVIDLSIAVLHDPTGLPLTAVATTDLVDPDAADSPWGLAALREAVARQLTLDGLTTSPSQVVLTTGAQQAISVAAACWVRPGDTVVVDDPTYPGALAAFRAAGAEVVGVPVDAHGVDVDVLAEALASRPALVYVQSAGHNPTGAVLTEHRRRRVAELVTATRVPLVEDRALAGLAWGPGPTHPAPPIAARLGDHPSVVAGSLSKVFWSGLRVGFARAPEPVAARLARVKTTQDLGSSSVSQLLAARLLAHPDTPAFLAQRNTALDRRRRVLGELLRTHLPEWEWDEPAGGLSLWVRLPTPNAEQVAHLALRHGVAVATAEGLSPGGGHPDRLRLSFAPPEPLLAEGVARLAAAWARR